MNKQHERIALNNSIGESRRLAGAAAFFLVIILSWACGGSNNNQQPVAQGGGNAGTKGNKSKNVSGTRINGGKYEASGVAQVPGTDKVLFVDDGRSDEVFVMQVDATGQQVGNVTAIRLGATVENPEGITHDGSRFYVVSSASSPKDAEKNSIVRFAFDPASQTVSNVEVIPDIRMLLTSRVPALRGEGEKKGKDGGLNIEGIAWDPQNQRLLLGLRSPIPAGQALVVPLKMRDAAGPFTADNINFEAATPVQLSLGGAGVRDIQYDSRLQGFLLISGAPENQDKGDFSLWQWDGSSQPVRRIALQPDMKPEAITEFKMGDQGFMLILGDESRYVTFDYIDLS
jgi:hypothetical protein